jgi:Carboxypeptidase regulatory-like domain
MYTRRKFACAAVLLLTTTAVMPILSQSIATGDITGVVTDPSGAVIPNATATLKSDESGALQRRTTNATGMYRFALQSARIRDYAA